MSLTIGENESLRTSHPYAPEGVEYTLPTGVSIVDYDSHQGIDGRDLTVNWTPPQWPDLVKQSILIIPEGVSPSPGQTRIVTFNDKTTNTWTGNVNMTTDGIGFPLIPGSYLVMVEAYAIDGSGTGSGINFTPTSDAPLAQTLAEAKTVAEGALVSFTATNETSEQGVLDAVKAVITNENITPTVNADFIKTVASVGTGGSVTGTITLTLAGTSSTTTEIVVNMAIAALPVDTAPAVLISYNEALAAVVPANYTGASWDAYQLVVLANVVTVANTQGEVDAATAAIIAAQHDLLVHN